MKTIKYLIIAVVAAVLSLGWSAPSKLSAQPGVSVSFQVFYNSLAPYGSWVNHAQYGSVWIPSVPRDFHPYMTNGRWVMTEFGNTWVSDYVWGWAPFHYGRWFYDDYYGWAWVPDYIWGPGWVHWRTGGGYYGWAPLLPGFHIGIAINIPVHFWVFVPHRHFMHARWHRYALPRARVTKIYQNTTVINNYYVYNNHQYVYGPRSTEIERHTRSKVPVYSYASRGNDGNFREVVTRANTESARHAIAARENNLTRNPVATPGSNRNTTSPANSTPSARSSNNTSVGAPRGSTSTAAPAPRTEIGREAATPSSRRSGETVSPNSRSREGAVPERSSSPAPPVQNRTPVGTPSRTETAPAPSRTTPARPAPVPNNSRAREATTPSRNSSPTVSPAPRSSSREAVSPSRTASPSRQTASPAPSRSSTPGNASPNRSSGRGASSERGGRN